MIDIAAARHGRLVMRGRCLAAAALFTPEGLRVEYRNSLSGRAWTRENRIAVPRPVTRRALHIYLHEVAHIVLHARTAGGSRRQPAHRQEFEAERWAFERMREAGIAVPRKSLERAKAYVAHKIAQARKRGAKRIDREAARWAGVE